MLVQYIIYIYYNYLYMLLFSKILDFPFDLFMVIYYAKINFISVFVFINLLV